MLLQLVLLFQVGLGLGQGIGSLRIMNGTEATRRQFPYQAGLLCFFEGYESEPSLCGGTILNEHWVLTAAHCLEEPKASLSKVLVQVGSIDVPGDEKAIMVKPRDTIVHPKFNRETVENDIALVFLSKKLKYNRYIRPAKLPTTSTYSGRKAFVSGWGLTTEKEPSSVLQYLKVTILSNKECQRRWTKYLNATGKRKEVYSSFVCINSEKGLPCQGDSGGPLVLADGSRTLVGVVSHGYDIDCKIKLPDISTRVSKFLKWINLSIYINIK